MRKITLAAIAAAVIATVSLAGCSGSSNSTSSSTGSANSGVLTVVSWKGEGSNVGDMPAINAAFEKAYPKIKLQYKYVDSADYDTYNNPRLAAGTAADVLMVDRVHMNNYAKQGFIADLSDQPWVKRLDKNLDAFDQVNGKTYQFPAESIPIGLYVNHDLLTQAGITSVPTDWPTFLADLKTLKAKNIGGFIVPNKGGWLGEQLSLDIAANYVSPSWASKYDNSKATFSPSWTPVVSEIQQLFTSGVVDPTTSLGLDPNTDGLPQFEAGKWAFMVQGAWALTDVQSNSKFNVTLNAFPGGAAGSPAKAFNFVGSGWAMNSKAKNPTAAKTYINFLTQATQAEGFLKAESAFSTLTDVKSPKSTATAPIAASFAAGDLVPSFAQVLNAPDAETGIQKGVENVFQNPNAPVSQTLTTLNSLVKPTPQP